MNVYELLEVKRAVWIVRGKTRRMPDFLSHINAQNYARNKQYCEYN